MCFFKIDIYTNYMEHDAMGKAVLNSVLLFVPQFFFITKTFSENIF